MKKISLFLVLSLMLTFATSVTAFADDYGVMPCYNNVGSANCDFTISNGTATATVMYSGYTGITGKVTANVLIEKRALWGLIWNDVEEWTVTSTSASDLLSFSTQVGTGTYRCTFEVTFEGSGGSSDVITDEITVKYS